MLTIGGSRAPREICRLPPNHLAEKHTPVLGKALKPDDNIRFNLSLAGR